ncbi:hypothetical protein NLG97_g3884 [Lecanicillium saksenae]|uniref:Uncharacterized protein n=1 Tax=Lecanicillium saksenae TaxID=468837 RepID=A0ACC1R0R9_9HYPO|nr:hypothetical protein NLG97_g3884 [Lecanicillium saksenae]
MNLYILCTLFTLGVAAESLRVPHPSGPYSVAYQVQDLTDTSRLDPSAPKGSNALRRILFSVFLPVDTNHMECSPEVLPYLPAETARYYSQLAPSMGLPEDMLGSFEVEFCNLSIDHPYDADIVEFPDGTVIRGDSEGGTETFWVEDIKVRTGDISFIINQLKNGTMMSNIIENFPHKINLANITVFGHSLGGAAAATFILENAHVAKGGLDFDGEIWGSVVNDELDAPFVTVSSAVNNGSIGLENWNPFWEHLRDTKLHLSIANTAHLSYLDIPILLSVYTLPEKFKVTEESVFGKIDGKVMAQTVNGILTAYFELLFGGCAPPLCSLGEQFVEISIERASLVGASC